MKSHKLISVLVPTDEAAPIEAAIPSGALCLVNFIDLQELRGVDEALEHGKTIGLAFSRALNE